MKSLNTYYISDYGMEDLTIAESTEVTGGMITVIGVGFLLVGGALALAPLAIAFYAGYHS